MQVGHIQGLWFTSRWQQQSLRLTYISCLQTTCYPFLAAWLPGVRELLALTTVALYSTPFAYCWGECMSDNTTFVAGETDLK